MTAQLGQNLVIRLRGVFDGCGGAFLAFFDGPMTRGGSGAFDEPQLLARQQEEAVPQELGVGIRIDRLVDNAGDSGELHQGRDGRADDDGQVHDRMGNFLPTMAMSPASSGFCGGVPAGACARCEPMLSSTGAHAARASAKAAMVKFRPTAPI